MVAREEEPGPVAAMFAADRASRELGIELVRHAEGSAVLRMTVTASMVNGHGIAHGGYLFLLADTAFACACNSYGPVTVAAGATVDFVAPAHEGDVLLARARECVRYGRSGIYDVRVCRVIGGPTDAGPAGPHEVDPWAVEGGGGRWTEEPVAEFRGRSRTVHGPAREEESR